MRLMRAQSLRVVIVAVLGCLLPASVRAQSTATAAPAVQANDAVAIEASATTNAEPELPPSEEDAPASSDTVFQFQLNGEFSLWFNSMSDLPLTPLPREPETTELGQNNWAETRLRLRAAAAFPQHHIRIVGQADAANGVLLGDRAYGVHPAAWRRDSALGLGGDTVCPNELSCERTYSGFVPRWLYAEWQSRAGLLRIGQMGFSWGLGLLANDGDTRPVFGDPHYGDIYERILFAGKPFGATSPFVVAAAGDIVFNDILADLRRGDHAYQGVLTAYYERDQRKIGLFAAYRAQNNAREEALHAGILDLYATWDFTDPGGGRVFAALEAAVIWGTTNMARTSTRPVDRVRQSMWALQIGRTSDHFDAIIEAGYASGDSNIDDGVQRRGTMDGDHRVGLILFPEVMAWESARAAAIVNSPNLVGHDAHGSQLIPTNGGVAGAMYLFPYMIWRPKTNVEARLGAVIARTTSPYVDPSQQALYSRSVNYRGGDPLLRDLGLEVDASVLLRKPLSDTVDLIGGVEAGIFFPGNAFNTASGETLPTMALLRLRAGLRW
jgi:hypothetical protein